MIRNKYIWLSLLISSLVGVILIIVMTYYTEITEVKKNGIIISRTGINTWKERMILPFYFTFISNMIALVISIIINFKIWKGIKISESFLKWEILMSVCLTITLIVYWAILAPDNIAKQKPHWIITNLFVHGFTPILAVTTYLIDVFKNKTKKINYPKTILLFITFPICWIIVATIIYFSLGGNYEDAIYSFLRYKQNNALSTIIYIIGIAISFVGFTSLFIWLNNKKFKTLS